MYHKIIRYSNQFSLLSQSQLAPNLKWIEESKIAIEFKERIQMGIQVEFKCCFFGTVKLT